MTKKRYIFYGGYADIEETNRVIGEMYYNNDYLMDTHTAVAYKVYEDYKRETGDMTPTVIASTASAYKFADSVTEAIGLVVEEDGFANVRKLNEKTKVRIPAGLKGLENKAIRHTEVLDIDQMKESVIKK